MTRRRLVGFTGTQQGMSREQKIAFQKLVWELAPTHFHHGDCIGADAEAHKYVRSTLVEGSGGRAFITGHPPINPSKRAFCQCDRLMPELDYLDRNRKIVDAVETMIACPYEMEEQRRSGTWATVRYAQKQQTALFIILRDGSIQLF